MVKVILSFRPQPSQPDLTAESLARHWLDRQTVATARERRQEAARELAKLLARSLSQPAERAIDLSDPVIVLAVLQAILRFEHGVIPYPLPQLAEGIKRAFDSIEDQARRQRRAEYLAQLHSQESSPSPISSPAVTPLRAERQALRDAAEALFTKPKPAAAAAVA